MMERGKSRRHDDPEGNGKWGLSRIPAVFRRGAIIGLVALAAADTPWVAQPVVEPPVQCETVGQAPAHPDATFSFMENQVILTGPASAIKEELGRGLVPIRSCALNYLDAPLGLGYERRQNLPHFADAPGDLEMTLFYVSGEESVAEVVSRINSEAPDTHVYADPNLLTGHSVCGNPEHTGGGSPFGGIPRLLSVGGEAAVRAFWEQWALQQIDAGWALKEELAGAAIMHQGEGVLVGVFDTSPFPDPWTGTAGRGNVPTIDTQEVVKWVNPTMDVEPLTLTVSYPRVVNVVTATEEIRVSRGITLVGDVRDHGLFVAGLVHAVAPASEIRLFRVLNEIGCGDLFTLNEALMGFIGEMEVKGEPLSDVVINLSLGVRDEEGLDILAPALSTDACGVEGQAGDIVSLCDTLYQASELGAVIVAAAGNEANGAEGPPPAQLPAAYDFVLAAEASNEEGKRACFSNLGDVRAPGGEGGPVGGDDCASVVHECSADCSDECSNGVISLVLYPPKGHAYWPTHYGYWSGTSFSAPLVSGLAALVLEADGVQHSAGNVEPREISNQDMVADAILCGAATAGPEGVINVAATLTDCLR